MDNALLGGKIEFIQLHRPGLSAGDYQIGVEQLIEDATGKIVDGNRFGNWRSFTVGGPRFALAPQDIHAVFPPPGSDGEHSNVLPHVIFNRSTLPWERSLWRSPAAGGKPGAKPFEYTGAGSCAPWLALLVFYQDEIESGQVTQPKLTTVGELASASGRTIDRDAPTPSKTALPILKRGADQHDADRLSVIDIDRALLAKIMPSLADLDRLAHVRQLKTLSVDLDASFLATLTANCLPDQTRSEAEVFGDGRYPAFRDALKSGGIRLSAHCSILGRRNGERSEWLLTDADGRGSFIARADVAGVGPVLNVFSNDAELGIVVANRLPMAGGTTVVHLVSLEARYDQGNASSACDCGPPAAFARFVSLKSWSFSCSRGDRTFTGLLRALDQDVLRDSPLRHWLRHGDKTVSWQRSPLQAARRTERLYALVAPPVPIPDAALVPAADQPGGWSYHGDMPCWIDRASGRKFVVRPAFGNHPRVPDQLLRLDSDTGIFDTTYAAAWQLGRLMALADRRFAVALTNWKRGCVQHRHRTTQAAHDLHLHVHEHPDLVSSLAAPPPEVSQWFDQRNLLQGVPFNYLVTDARMLPNESIRFFEVDPLWVDCLLDGAFSLGSVTEADHRGDFQHIVADNRYPRMSGLLLRSEVVAGWPGLIVEASCRLPADVELFGDAPTGILPAEDVPGLRRALEAIGLPLPRQIGVGLSRDGMTCVLQDLDTNPDHVDTLLAGDSDHPQLCLAMPDRERLYSYTIVNTGSEGQREPRLTLPLLRQQRLGGGVMLCLFQGAIETIDIHLKPETLHFGLQRADGGYSKTLKSVTGEPLAQPRSVQLDGALWKTGPGAPIGGSVLAIAALADRIEGTLAAGAGDGAAARPPVNLSDSARFALQMIEGNELVRFRIGGPN